jgi:hypothetical protein
MKLLAYAVLNVFLLASGESVFGLSNADLQYLAQGTITFDQGVDKTALVSSTPGRIFVEGSLAGRKVRLFVDTGFPFLHFRQGVVAGNPKAFETPARSNFKNSRLVKSLRLGKLVLDGVPVVDSPEFDTLETNLRVDGTAGMAVLSRLYWQFDQTSQTLTIFKNPQPLKDPIDINPFYDLRIVVDGTIDGSKASWTIDTGWYSGYPVSGLQKESLPPSTVLHPVSGRMWQSNHMQDITKDPTVGVLRNVVIGATALQTMSFYLLWPKDEYSRDYSGIFNNTGILPLQFFDGGTFQVNGPDAQVAWTIPPRSSPPTGNNLQLYGFEQVWGADYRAEIVGIDEQSWAYQNGLRLGDIFIGYTLKIGGKHVSKLDSEYLRGDPHAVVSFDYERDGVVRHLEAPYSDAMRDVLFQN